MKTYHRQNPNIRQQSGAILIFVLVVLGILIISSTQFFSMATDSTKISGASRDSSESILLTESAMENLRGQFINNLDYAGDVDVALCDFGGTSVDKCEAGDIRENMTAPVTFLMPYMYFVSDAAALDQDQPSLLQTIANGEGAFDESSSQLASQIVSSATTQLRVNDLFANSFKPLLFTVNDNGLLVDSAAADWDAETGTHKAAAWIEVILNPDDDEAIDLYVQAVAQVGSSRSFLQRYVGSYFNDDTLGELVSPLAESSNINRDP